MSLTTSIENELGSWALAVDELFQRYSSDPLGNQEDTALEITGFSWNARLFSQEASIEVITTEGMEKWAAAAATIPHRLQNRDGFLDACARSSGTRELSGSLGMTDPLVRAVHDREDDLAGLDTLLDGATWDRSTYKGFIKGFVIATARSFFPWDPVVSAPPAIREAYRVIEETTNREMSLEPEMSRKLLRKLTNQLSFRNVLPEYDQVNGDTLNTIPAYYEDYQTVEPLSRLVQNIYSQFHWVQEARRLSRRQTNLRDIERTRQREVTRLFNEVSPSLMRVRGINQSDNETKFWVKDAMQSAVDRALYQDGSGGTRLQFLGDMMTILVTIPQ